ncbi:hypothetical protein PVL29_016175 [Vitis rotundifolia]|uniref:Uncharacterized protein n=1 Tax=Vitis rotundifolia TaxID=103349 RepID=A0AA38ZFQ0_VITRO|nr:hypothetical protein PVL29_016175 [Vitis rotundifolia]
MTGNCRSYDALDNRLQLHALMCLHGKKKSLRKRITGFHFSPKDPGTVMVTCADSQVRILHGTHVIGKYKGLLNAGNQMSASFTSDGKHIVSAGGDSNVYVWNCSSEGEPALSQAKSIRAFEHFPTNASVAISWCGMKYRNHRKLLQSLQHPPMPAVASQSMHTVQFQEHSMFLNRPQAPPNLHFFSIPNVIPSELVRAAVFPGFIEAVMTKMKDPCERLLDQLKLPATAIVADTFCSGQWERRGKFVLPRLVTVPLVMLASSQLHF